MMWCKQMTLAVCFSNGSGFSDFVMEYGDDPGMMYFSVTDGTRGEDENSHVQCYRTLDEMEYLARRILDAVDYQRKQIEKGEQ